jgi:hypothetical protein
MKILFVRLLSAACVAATLGFALHASARPPHPGECECAYIELPVLCSDGVVYINPCVAACFGQTDCVPYGDPGPLP